MAFSTSSHTLQVLKNEMEKIVLDTNCLVSSLKRDSKYYPIWRDFMSGKYILCVSDDILDEYEEIIGKLTGSQDIARNVISAILNRSNTEHVEVYFHFQLIKSDVDDNKFVDCAIKSNARYIVSNDCHFQILKDIPFPFVEIIDIDSFLEILKM